MERRREGEGEGGKEMRKAWENAPLGKEVREANYSMSFSLIDPLRIWLLKRVREKKKRVLILLL